ncbi:peptidoglycan DD-metalloendopeptidase family protein [Salibaculum griseiflavum]|uniref:Peptidase M23 n=1 Tax=Salibaculum griseiflavum TaxID=1914409 RepID=A0A2V1P488_9RHOB|nr:peptidoglycan DD-metalloendopeptidase family protein [Salibaculum griseiflavum]PWG16600.1 peptidase M23 [Salibaculum griseiflavum]
MSKRPLSRPVRCLLAGTALVALAACDSDGNLADFDLRDLGGGFDTSDSVTNLPNRPRPDNRGVISYPGYQVVVARQGETVRQIAGRLDVNAEQLANYNAIDPDTPLRRDEIVALPGRVAEPSPATGAVATGPIQPPSQIDVTTLASDAIDRAGDQRSTPTPQPTPAADAPTGVEPVRHQVQRGETVYSIARLYNVPVRGLAEWNGLGADLTIREGQQLLIPATGATPPSPAAVTTPGQGTQTPTPPSAAAPLPAETPEVAPEAPPAPDIGQQSSAATDAPLIYPVSGSIIREYSPGRNEGIDIAADAGTPVKAAADGTVAAITENTNGAKIVVLRHTGNILTVYVNVQDLTVTKDDSVSQGQTIASIAAGSPSALHFEVRDGLESVDPADYLP